MAPDNSAVRAAGLTYGTAVYPHEAGYASQAALMEVWRCGDAARSWWLGPRMLSLQLSKQYGGGVWKQTERFKLEKPEADLRKLQRRGIEHPSSYADVFWQMHGMVHGGMPTPLRATYNRIFEWWSGGPWSEARQIGTHRGRWHRYDLRNAYRWAATLGLPDTATFRVQRKMGSAPGMWVMDPAELRPDLAPSLRGGNGLIVISSEEIEATKFRGTVLRGVTWEGTLPVDYIERTLARLHCSAECGRAYWGRMISRDPLTVRMTGGREWDLKRNPWQNFVWGWLIVGRVRTRVFQAAAGRAAHVYVDEVVVPFEIPEGTAPGSWRKKEIYDQGVTVIRTGHFGPPDAAPAMQTGVKRGKREAVGAA